MAEARGEGEGRERERGHPARGSPAAASTSQRAGPANRGARIPAYASLSREIAD